MFCGETIVPKGLRCSQLSFNFTVRNDIPGGDFLKKLITALTAFILSITIGLSASAQATTYKVVRGDSLWKIAVKYEVGLSELIKANPSIKNPNLIYPGQVINIPEAAPLKTFESEVIRLINQERTSRGLPALTTDWQLSRVARYKSQDMVDRGYFSHYSPTYGSPFDMMEAFDFASLPQPRISPTDRERRVKS